MYLIPSLLFFSSKNLLGKEFFITPKETLSIFTPKLEAIFLINILGSAINQKE